MSEAPRYTIKTIQDMGQIPVDRIDAFLTDLRSMLLTANGLSAITDAFVKGVDPSLSCPCMPESITWVDDGANDLLALHIGDDVDLLHGPVKNEHIEGMVDAMHLFAKALRGEDTTHE